MHISMNHHRINPNEPLADIQAQLFSSVGHDTVARKWRLFAKALLNATGSAIFVVDPSGQWPFPTIRCKGTWVCFLAV